MTASREAGSSTAKVRSAQAGVSFCSAAVLFDLILHLNAMEPFDNETRRWCVQMQARIGRGWTQDETSERNAMGIGDNGENIACVYGTGEGSTEVVYVGSSAALRCPTLEDHIHIMVSFGPPDLRNLVDRPQEGWDQFLRGLCIDHFAIQLADPKTTAPGEGPLCQKMANCIFLCMAEHVRPYLPVSEKSQRTHSCWTAFPLLVRKQSQQRCFGGLANISASYDCL